MDRVDPLSLGTARKDLWMKQPGRRAFFVISAAGRRISAMAQEPVPSKKNELKTYSQLGLYRDHKSKARRRRVEAGRLHLYNGGFGPERPYHKVARADYLETWERLLAAHRLAHAPEGVDPARWAEMVRHPLEIAVYDDLAARYREAATLEREFRKQQGRGMTPQEKSIFARAARRDGETKPDTAARRSETWRRALLDDVVSAVESRMQHQPARLQQAWATVVGFDAAQDSFLESVDEQKGLAFCRCLNSTLAFRLRRNPAIPAGLGKLLGLNIRKLVFR